MKNLRTAYQVLAAVVSVVVAIRKLDESVLYFRDRLERCRREKEELTARSRLIVIGS